MRPTARFNHGIDRDLAGKHPDRYHDRWNRRPYGESRLRRLLDVLSEPMNALGDGVQIPQILTVMEVRSSIRRLVEPSLPSLHVTAYQELTPETNIQPIGCISLDGFRPKPNVYVGNDPLWV